MTSDEILLALDNIVVAAGSLSFMDSEFHVITGKKRVRCYLNPHTGKFAANGYGDTATEALIAMLTDHAARRLESRIKEIEVVPPTEFG